MTTVWFSDLVEETPSAEAMRRAAEKRLERGRITMREADEEAAAVILVDEAVDAWVAEEQQPHPQAVETGWSGMDASLGRPIRVGELILLAARAGVGKTWALQSWIEASLRGDPESRALIIELEMLASHLAERLAGHALGVPPADARRRARDGTVTGEVVLDAQPSLRRLALHERFVGVEQLPEAIARAAERLGARPTIVAVDYLGLLRWDGSMAARTYERASENAKRLKAIAASERVAIVAAAQLSREGGDGSRKPSLDALRDSGVIEEAADRVIALWRPTPIEEEGRSIRENVEIDAVILKNRFGPTGDEHGLVYDHALRLVERAPRASLIPDQREFPY